MLAAACRVERLFKVGAGAFSPPPRVESAVARLLPLQAPPFPLPDPERFARVVQASFSMRRKTLRNSLRGVVDESGFSSTGIDPSRRAETLSPAEFAALAATPAPALDV
jgi:16S rRNA (adenine1518-N6/adenine1519-N6)-dimethyltransferase